MWYRVHAIWCGDTYEEMPIVTSNVVAAVPPNNAHGHDLGTNLCSIQ